MLAGSSGTFFTTSVAILSLVLVRFFVLTLSTLSFIFDKGFLTLVFRSSRSVKLGGRGRGLIADGSRSAQLPSMLHELNDLLLGSGMSMLFAHSCLGLPPSRTLAVLRGMFGDCLFKFFVSLRKFAARVWLGRGDLWECVSISGVLSLLNNYAGLHLERKIRRHIVIKVLVEDVDFVVGGKGRECLLAVILKVAHDRKKFYLPAKIP